MGVGVPVSGRLCGRYVMEALPGASKPQWCNRRLAGPPGGKEGKCKHILGLPLPPQQAWPGQLFWFSVPSTLRTGWGGSDSGGRGSRPKPPDRIGREPGEVCLGFELSSLKCIQELHSDSLSPRASACHWNPSLCREPLCSEPHPWVASGCKGALLSAPHTSLAGQLMPASQHPATQPISTTHEAPSSRKPPLPAPGQFFLSVLNTWGASGHTA